MAQAISPANIDNIPTIKISSPRDLEEYRQALLAASDPNAPRIIVCCGTGCQATGSVAVVEALKAAVEEAGWEGKVVPQLKKTGCHGFCSRGPLVIIEPLDLFYQRVKGSDAADIVNLTLMKGEVIKRLQYKPADAKEPVAKSHDIPYYAKQTRIVLENIGKIDPFEIKDALVHGAYRAMAKALTEMSPAQVIEEVSISKLRGRGGGGFPTGLKWESCAKQAGNRYVICNADEGDPGAFMDRSLLEGDPHRVLEGMALTGYALGSHRGYVYCRAEYPLAVHRLQLAILQAREYGL
ncbi:MAG: NAD(P)H-dependent oxidoreductase subunit E, partial [Desulfarculus sp.]|nr:NAD(P)H-dependent oxidoreductase subunit E [Desulfarculus sp.]